MEELIHVTRYEGEGIGGYVPSGEFLVSILNHLPRLCPEKTVSMQKHIRSDECFVLLQGRAMLFLADGEDAPDRIEAVELEPGTICTVPKNVWHSPVMTPDARILLVENRDTTDENSPRVPLTKAQQERVLALGAGFPRG